MATPVFVTERDLHAMLRVVNPPELGDDGEGLPWSTLQALMALIPCTCIAFNGMDVQDRRSYFGQTIGEPDPPGDETAFWAHYGESDCSYPERTGDLASVLMTTDFRTRRENRQTPIYVDYFGPLGADHCLDATLPDGPGRQTRLVLFRGRTDPDFTERDRALLILLRPHLHATHQQVLRRRLGIPKLTIRQWELLRLVEAGLSNIQIARRLHLADNTVSKHLENIFERLQVFSRTAAIARAFPRRLLPDVPPPEPTPLVDHPRSPSPHRGLPDRQSTSSM